ISQGSLWGREALGVVTAFVSFVVHFPPATSCRNPSPLRGHLVVFGRNPPGKVRFLRPRGLLGRGSVYSSSSRPGAPPGFAETQTTIARAAPPGVDPHQSGSHSVLRGTEPTSLPRLGEQPDTAAQFHAGHASVDSWTRLRRGTAWESSRLPRA